MEKSYRPYLFLGVGSSPLTEYKIQNGKAHIIKRTSPNVPKQTIPLRDSSTILLKRNPLQWLLGLGSIEITASNSQKMVWENLKGVKSVKHDLDNWEEIEGADKSQVTLDEKPTDSDIQAVKVTPASDSELEKIRKEFKFYSPAQKTYRNAKLPKVGEEWKSQRPLPSGLLLWVSQETKWWQQTRWWDWTKEDTTDYRLVQYNIEQHQRENPQLSSQIQNTYSVSWHPTMKWLATTGDGCITKLWDAETGELITNERPFAQRIPGMSIFLEGKIISWSSDGEMFSGEKYIFDGRNGNSIGRKKSDGSIYSSSRFEEFLRDGNPQLLSSNNFSRWKPNSSHYIDDDSLKTLTLRNGRTGEIEKIIDCDVLPSYITDFAWHPKGRFIAVAFSEHFIRIIDFDEAKIVADLSVQLLVGWSPDGKILVARDDKSKDDFVIWDALETIEKPMPEEMKNELWFKRFFRNISADGLRYIKNEHGKTNIYSLESDELLFTLPKRVKSAAWCPTDGGLLATCGGSETDIWKI